MICISLGVAKHRQLALPQWPQPSDSVAVRITCAPYPFTCAIHVGAAPLPSVLYGSDRPPRHDARECTNGIRPASLA
eukprot:6886555-Prymnesium_polylepis.2